MAAKRITLPLGLDISDINNIGTYTLVSGRDYDTNLIKLHNQIRSVLGESISKVRGLCLSPNINKYAAFKPNRVGNASGMVVSSTVDGNIFEYNKPDNTSGYKMGEFAGYNHQAPIPEVFYIDNIEFLSGAGEVATTQILVQLPEWDVREFGIDSIYIRTSKDGGFIYDDFSLLGDANITNRSISVEVRYQKLYADYIMNVEVWYGDTSRTEPKYVKHNDSPGTINMIAQSEPQLIVKAEFPYTIFDSNKTYNYSTGDYSVTYIIEEVDQSGSTQVGGTFDIYARRTSDSTATYQKTVTVSSTSSTTTSGTLTFAKPLTEDVTLEWRQV